MATTINLELTIPDGAVEKIKDSFDEVFENFNKIDSNVVLKVNGQTPDAAGNVDVDPGDVDLSNYATTVALTNEVERASTAEATKLARNGSNMLDPAAFRTSAGLGTAAVKNTGTTGTDVVLANNSTLTGAAQKANNGSDFANLTTTLTNLGGARLIETVSTASPGASYNFPDVTNATVKIVNLVETLTTITLPTPGAGKSFLAIYKQNASGNRQITHSGTNPVRFPGGTTLTLSTAANAIDIVSYVCWDGSTWDCLSGVVTIDSVKLFPEENFANGGFSALPMWRASDPSVPNGSGTLKVMYVTARKTETIANMKLRLGATAYTSPTLFRMGIYTVAANGDLTLVAASANSTSGVTTASAALTRALASPYTVNYGQRYALAFLGVAGSQGTFAGGFLGHADDAIESGTRIVGSVISQTDLPASVAVGDILNSGNLVQIKALP